jgi:hypothetical protein
MASRASIPLLFLLAAGLLFAAAVGTSREEEGRRGEQWEHQHGKQEGRGRGGEREHEGEQEQDSRRPYVFGPRSFRRLVRSDQGSVKALRPFDEESRLLRGIKNYRVEIVKANPRSFIVPGYADADGISYVAQGMCYACTVHARTASASA